MLNPLTMNDQGDNGNPDTAVPRRWTCEACGCNTNTESDSNCTICGTSNAGESFVDSDIHIFPCRVAECLSHVVLCCSMESLLVYIGDGPIDLCSAACLHLQIPACCCVAITSQHFTTSRHCDVCLLLVWCTFGAFWWCCPWIRI